MPPMKDLTIEALRQQNEKLYAKINGKLNRTFKGVEREQIIKSDTTGKNELFSINKEINDKTTR